MGKIKHNVHIYTVYSKKKQTTTYLMFFRIESCLNGKGRKPSDQKVLGLIIVMNSFHDMVIMLWLRVRA